MTPDTDPNADRRKAILSFGLKVLIEKGWRRTSMIAIARAASASKETLYNWFGDKAGFFAAMIRENAAALDRALPEDFPDLPLEDGLRSFGRAFLRLVTGEASLAINRAAIAEAGGDPALGQTLLAEGKHRSLPRLAAWLSRHMVLDEPTRAAESFIILVKGEIQLECLLGAAPAPSEAQINAQVDRAIADFLTLYGGAQRP